MLGYKVIGPIVGGSPTGSATASSPSSTTACSRSRRSSSSRPRSCSSTTRSTTACSTPLGRGRGPGTGKSILFMLETNPGPGLGHAARLLVLRPPSRCAPRVPAAMIIHFFGGIHEIYFPYVLMKPTLILAAIAGGASGIAIFKVTDAGLVATPSPGSIFAYMAVTPRGATTPGCCSASRCPPRCRSSRASRSCGFPRATETFDLDEAQAQSVPPTRAARSPPRRRRRERHGRLAKSAAGRRLRRRNGHQRDARQQLSQQLKSTTSRSSTPR